MKKIIITLIAMVLFTISISAADIMGGVGNVGEVKETDITAFIDESAIESYNFNGYTYIIAEDLMNYGFDVVWNGTDRTLKITREKYNFTPYVPESINQIKTDVTFKTLYHVYTTDIKTYVNGTEIPSCNINGRTIIWIESLNVFGNCVYDNDTRTIKLDILGKEIEGLEERGTPDDYKKGIFKDGELIYGYSHVEYITQNGLDTTTRIGNFAGNKYINITTSEMKFYYTTYDYRIGDDFYYCRTNTPDGLEIPEYKFDRHIISRINGETKYHYLSENGELYLIRKTQDAEDRSFEGILFVRGEKVYEGTIYYKPVHGVERALHIYYAKDYNDENGLIYYADYGWDDVYYEGQVVNGLPNGQGTAYHTKRQYSPDEPYYYYYTLDDMTNAPTMKNRVMWSGNFVDGEYHDTGFGYSEFYGLPMYYGTWVNGIKNGHFYVYCDGGSDYDGTHAVCAGLDTYYVNDVLHGKTIEYRAKGNMFIGGIYKFFVGDMIDGIYGSGTFYSTYYDAEKNENIVYLAWTASYDEETGIIHEINYDRDGNITHERDYDPFEFIGGE